MARRRSWPLWAALLALSLGTTPASAQVPPVCSDARFLVARTTPLLDTSAPAESVVLAGTSVAVTTGCPAVPALRMKAYPRGTRIRVPLAVM